MPKMEANRNVTVSTTAGHVLRFKEGEVKNVPMGAVQACLAVGMILAPGETLDEASTEAAVPGGPERLAKIKDATKAILARNARDDFGAGGRPTRRAIEARVGFKVDDEERDTVWAALNYERLERLENEKLKRTKPSDRDDLFDAMANVIDALVAQGDDDNFTRDGEPQVKAIEEFLGYNITHDERDEAWKRFQARSSGDDDEAESTEATLDAAVEDAEEQAAPADDVEAEEKAEAPEKPRRFGKKK